MSRALLLLLLAAPALAQTPEARAVAETTDDRISFDVFCPGRISVYAYGHCDPPTPCPPAPYSCQAADLTKDGTVTGGDFIACSALGGKPAEACAAVVQIYWEQSCQGSATSSPPSGQDSASTQE